MKTLNTFEIVRLIGDAPKELFNFTETSVLTRMAFIGNREGKNINPGINELISQTKLSRSPLIRAINSLVKKGVLILCCKRSQGSWDKSCYDINVTFLQEVQEPKNKHNISYKTKSNIRKKPPLSKEKLSTSSIAETLLSGVAETLDKNQVVSQRHGGGVAETLLSGVAETPLPYIQLLEPIYPPSYYVELSLDPAVKVDDKKLKKSPKQKNSWTPEVMEVFEHWKKILNHPRARLDEHRRKHIVKVLECGFSVDELKIAIEGVKKTPHNMGINDRKKVYDDFDVIFRNSKQVERFIRNFDIPEAAIKENVATGFKLSFTERNKSMVNAMAELGAEMFPEYADTFINCQSKDNLLTFKKELEINGCE
jgi:hypothetical protein